MRGREWITSETTDRVVGSFDYCVEAHSDPRWVVAKRTHVDDVLVPRDRSDTVPIERFGIA